jgi:YesN/AraC family two-component response regulator
MYSSGSGQVFWARAICIERHFTGALVGGGFQEDEKEKIESLAELMDICVKSISSKTKDQSMIAANLAGLQSELSAKISELKERFPQGFDSDYQKNLEKELLAALEKRDTESGKQIINEFLASLSLENSGKFNLTRYRAVELVILISRLGIRQAFTMETVLENDNRNLSLIEKAKNIDELAAILHHIVDDITEQIHRFRGIQHSSALRKAEQYIQRNFSRKISLEEIAKVSGFSSPYFSTLFKKEMGENLSGYLSRLRVEKATELLTSTSLSLNAIAKACGIEDQRWFSKIFKAHTGKSPGKFRRQGGV